MGVSRAGQQTSVLSSSRAPLRQGARGGDWCGHKAVRFNVLVEGEGTLYATHDSPSVYSRVPSIIYSYVTHTPVHSTAVCSYVPRHSCYLLLRSTVLLSTFTFHPAAVCLYVPHYSCCLLLSTAIVCFHASPAGCLRGGESRPG
ncbi:unnamed protein product, partial [Ectocarpus sp. 4 AP-2014]